MSYLDYTIDADSELAMDSYLDDDAENYAEARGRSRGRGRPSPVRPATGGNLFRPRPAPGGPAGGGGVTQAQLEAALGRVREQVTANANAIKTVDERVRTVISDTQKLQADTRKDVAKLRSELKTTQTISALVPLIAPPGSRFGQVAPLLHLVGPDLLGSGSGGGQASSTSSSSNLLGGNNLLAIGALAYASGVFGQGSNG